MGGFIFCDGRIFDHHFFKNKLKKKSINKNNMRPVNDLVSKSLKTEFDDSKSWMFPWLRNESAKRVAVFCDVTKWRCYFTQYKIWWWIFLSIFIRISTIIYTSLQFEFTSEMIIFCHVHSLHIVYSPINCLTFYEWEWEQWFCLFLKL